MMDKTARLLGDRSERRRAATLTFLLAILLMSTPLRAQTCIGDCNQNGDVTIGELITIVNIALGSADLAACVAGDVNQDGAITVNEIIQAVRAALDGCRLAPTATPTATETLPLDVSPTATPPATATATQSSTATATATSSPTATAVVTATARASQTSTPTATATVPTVTNTATNTPTATQTPPAGQIAPPDALFNGPLDIPLDQTVSVLDFVSFPDGDSVDRVRWDVIGMNPNPSLPGGRARLVISLSCFGNGTQEIQLFTGGQSFACGQSVVDTEITADSRTGQVTISAVGGPNTYVQWVLTGTATRIN